MKSYADFSSFSDKEKKYLTEERYSFKYGMKMTMTIKCLAKIINDFPINYKDKGWKLLLSHTKTRNNIVHPKSSKDMIIHDADIEEILQGYSWFYKNVFLLVLQIK